MQILRQIIHKKKLLLIILTFITINALEAQVKDKKATQILDEVTDKTKSYKTIKVEFTYRMENPEANINESKNGMLIIKGDKYRLSIAGQIVICNSETIWTYIEDAEEVQINDVEDSDESITPDKLLTSYNDNYKSKFIKETLWHGKTVQIIELTPLEGKTYYKVQLIIDKVRKQILNFQIFDKNGSTYTYQINKFIPDLAVEDSEFIFNPEEYPDVEIIDMR